MSSPITVCSFPNSPDPLSCTLPKESSFPLQFETRLYRHGAGSEAAAEAKLRDTAIQSSRLRIDQSTQMYQTNCSRTTTIPGRGGKSPDPNCFAMFCPSFKASSFPSSSPKNTPQLAALAALAASSVVCPIPWTAPSGARDQETSAGFGSSSVPITRCPGPSGSAARARHVPRHVPRHGRVTLGGAGASGTGRCYHTASCCRALVDVKSEAFCL